MVFVEKSRGRKRRGAPEEKVDQNSEHLVTAGELAEKSKENTVTGENEEK